MKHKVRLKMLQIKEKNAEVVQWVLASTG